MRRPTALYLLLTLAIAGGCSPEPELHLFDGGDIELTLPMVNIDLNTYWDYETAYGEHYNWREEWHYGWDDEDQRLFGNIGYATPDIFQLRRYYTGDTPRGPHRNVLANTIRGNSFRGKYNWGFWDILVWNDIVTPDGVQSLNFDEQAAMDNVTAFTNATMSPSRYHAPVHNNSFYQPEDLFAAYAQGEEINRDLRGFEYDAATNTYIKKLKMTLEPVTYIYLTQVIIHRNKGRIAGVDGSANMSGMARTTTVNDGKAGDDAVSVYYNTRFKRNCDMHGENVDIAGGKLMTFGICGQRANRIQRLQDVSDDNRHFMDVTMHFNNGLDSTFVFDVTDQVRRRWKGGVITVELDMDSVRLPTRSGGSAFDAVVLDYIEETHEFGL